MATQHCNHCAHDCEGTRQARIDEGGHTHVDSTNSRGLRGGWDDGYCPACAEAEMIVWRLSRAAKAFRASDQPVSASALLFAVEVARRNV